MEEQKVVVEKVMTPKEAFGHILNDSEIGKLSSCSLLFAHGIIEKIVAADRTLLSVPIEWPDLSYDKIFVVSDGAYKSINEYVEVSPMTYLQKCVFGMHTKLENPNIYAIIKYMLDNDAGTRNGVGIKIHVSHLIKRYQMIVEHGMNNCVIHGCLASDVPEFKSPTNYVELFSSSGCDVVFDVTMLDVVSCAEPDLIYDLDDNALNRYPPTDPRLCIPDLELMMLLDNLANRCQIIFYKDGESGEEFAIAYEDRYKKMFNNLLKDGHCLSVFNYLNQITNVGLRKHIEEQVHKCILKLHATDYFDDAID